jgi:Tfp pilus assembly protein PilN
MQEINLLQTKIKDRNASWEKRSRLFTTVFSLVLILELVLTGGVYMLTNSKQSAVAAIEEESQKIQKRIDERQADLSSAKSFQAQLKNLRGIVDNHVYWSGFFDELGKRTYVKTQYMSLKAETDGKIHVEGLVSNYTDLGKLILGLNTSNKFSNVKLLSVQPSSQEASGYMFSLDLVASKDLLKKE